MILIEDMPFRTALQDQVDTAKRALRPFEFPASTVSLHHCTDGQGQELIGVEELAVGTVADLVTAEGSISGKKKQNGHQTQQV